MVIKNIFFDFDGVLAESVGAKTDAFKEMYLPHGEEIANKVVKYHIENGGISRYEKFKYWEKTFFGKEITEEEIEKMAQTFSNIVLQKVIDSSEVEGVSDFLNKYSSKLNFWVITGTPTPEIKYIVKKRELSKHFIGLHGSPQKKEYWTEFLIENHNLNREETLFLGDATTDQRAAAISKLYFALRENSENESLFKDFDGIRFRNFFDLEKILLSKQML